MIPLFALLRSTGGKVIVGIVLAALLLAALVAWFARHDAKVIEGHEIRRDLDDAKATVRAERDANAASIERQSAQAKSEEELQHVQQQAEARDPEGARRPVGPATRAVIDGLRHDRGTRAAR